MAFFDVGESWVSNLIHRIDNERTNVRCLALMFECLSEAASVVVYIYATYQQPELNSTGSTFNRSTRAFNSQSVLSIVFVVMWLWNVLTVRSIPFVSMTSLTTLATAVPQLVVAAGSFRDPHWAMVWIPMYLRVWNFRDTLLRILDFPQVETNWMNRWREALGTMITGITVLLTSSCTFQATDSFTSGKTIDFLASLYFLVVTSGTIGYGDITPSSDATRLVMVGLIAIAVYQVPSYLNEFRCQRMARSSLRCYSSRKGKRRHVIVTGHLEHQDILFFLREMYAGARRREVLRVVVLSPLKMADETRVMLLEPWFRHRVTYVEGSPQLHGDLDRCDLKFAEAVFFFFPSTNNTCYFSDYDVISNVHAVHAVEPRMPKHVALRRQRYKKLVAAVATSVFEIQRVEYMLLGLAAIHPGVVPFLISLLRQYDTVEAEANDWHWTDEVRWSQANTVAMTFVSPATAGMTILQAAATLLEAQVVPLCSVFEGKLSFDFDEPLKLGAQVATIAPSAEVAQAALHHARRQAYEPQNAHTTISSPHSARPGSPGEEQRRAMATIVPSGEGVVDIADASYLTNHVVIVDLAPALLRPSFSQEAEEETELFAASDLLNILIPIRKENPEAEIVILTLSCPKQFPALLYQTNMRPVNIVRGCGLNPDDIAKCNLAEADSCIVCKFGDTVDPLMDEAAALVTLMIRKAPYGSDELPFRLVTQMQRTDSIALLSRMKDGFEPNWTYRGSLLHGSVVCPEMLLVCAIQAYFNPLLPGIITALILGTGGHSILGSAPVAELPVFQSGEAVVTYADIAKEEMSTRAAIPIGLFRICSALEHRGQRYMYVNPLPLAQVRETDTVYYLRTSPVTESPTLWWK